LTKIGCNMENAISIERGRHFLGQSDIVSEVVRHIQGVSETLSRMDESVLVGTAE
jgi:hypothetical protein